MTPGWITTMTSSQIPQLLSSLRDRVPTSFFTQPNPRRPRPKTTGAAASQLTSTPSQAQAPANARAQAPNARLSFPSLTPSSSSSLSPADVASNKPDVALCRRRRRRLECLLAARRTMDYINDSVEYVRGTYNAAVDTASTVYRAATSKTAQRTVLTTLLFAFLSSVLFGLACVAYLAFYHEYLPDQVTTVPVHLQYG